MSKSLPTNTCTEPWFCSRCGFGQTPEEPAQRDRRAQAVPWQGQHTHTHTHIFGGCKPTAIMAGMDGGKVEKTVSLGLHKLTQKQANKLAK